MNIYFSFLRFDFIGILFLGGILGCIWIVYKSFKINPIKAIIVSITPSIVVFLYWMIFIGNINVLNYSQYGNVGELIKFSAIPMSFIIFSISHQYLFIKETTKK